MELLLGKKVKEKIGFADAEKLLCKNFIGEHFFFIQPENDDMRLDNILEKARIFCKECIDRGKI